MQTNTRRQRRSAWLAAAALGLATQVAHASEPKPLLPPSDMSAPSEVVPAAHRFAGTAVGHTPGFSGFGQGGSTPRAGSFPQPDVPPSSLALPPAGKVVPAEAVREPRPVVRTPQQFGNGWRNVVNQKVLGREAPAAMILAPRSTGGPRPEWGWHGYDQYNVGRNTESGEPVRASDADMAPFMKYAHLWRPSTVVTPYVQMPPARPVVASTEPAPIPSSPAPAPLPSTVTPLMHSVLSEPATRDPAMMTPSVTTPLPDLIQQVQPTEFRAATDDGPPPGDPPPTTRDPLPPLTSSEVKPKIMYIPPPEIGGPNRVPLSVREKIHAVCAGKVRNLVIELQSPVRMRIAFQVKDQIEAEMTTNLLAALPELAPYKVDFEVNIAD